MSIVPQSAKCDGCGKSRQEDANHWRSVKSLGHGAISIEDGVVLDADAHACGQTCVLKLVSGWLATGNWDEVRRK